MQSKEYYNLVVKTITKIEETQESSIQQAGQLIKQAFQADGVLHVFSTGHSHMMVEEMFYRSGGLVPVDPVFDSGTMLHHGAVKSTQFERLPGYAQVIYSGIETQPGDPFIIISNSGVNSVPVEMAQIARADGMKVIAITSRNISQQLVSRTTSGKKLMDEADIVIDNCIIDSDASIKVGQSGLRVGAISTVLCAYIVQRIVLAVAYEYEKEGSNPPIFASANMPGGDAWNEPLVKKYKSRIRGL
jgi:uncharacterized phosphosugar-binding protein